MTAPPHIRQPFARFAVFAGFALGLGLAAVAAQPAEVEDPRAKPPLKKVKVEDEDPKGTVKKKVVVDDPDPTPKPAGSRPDARLDELTRAAATTPHAALKALFTRYAVPFDQLTAAQGVTLLVRPLPLFRSEAYPKQFGVNELDGSNPPKETRPLALAEVKRIDFFEELALAEAALLLKPPPAGTAPPKDEIPVEDRAAAAELVLAAALRFHDHARENPFPGLQGPIRQGKAWDRVRTDLADRLRDVRLQQLRRAVAVSDWAKSKAAGTRLMAAYPKDAGVAKEVAEARVAEAELLMKTGKHEEKVKARELLDEFETRYPGGGGDPARKIRRELSADAARLFERARGFKAAGNLVDARNDLTRADALDPGVPGLRELKRELGTGYPVLYVGVRQFPEKMSPATARLDSERQAVQLLFEGLLEEVPDLAGGTRYRPGAALAAPAVVPGGRDLLVRPTPQTANGTGGFGPHDVIETMKLLRARPELWPAAGLPWLDDQPVPGGGNALRLGFRHGHPDPRVLLTFKLLPALWLADRRLAADDAGFAAKPFGTGPFRVHTSSVPGAPGPRELAFADNPTYGRTRDRANQPHLREVRLVEVPRVAPAGFPDPLDEFRAGKLHILPDLTPSDVTRILAQSGGPGGKGQVVTAATNRRVHVLALNLRRPPVQNRDLRKGLSLAVDREGVLNDVFRGTPAEYRRFTAAMSGPFPPGSWATPKGLAGQGVPLLNRDEAGVRLKRYLTAAGAVAELRLAYPSDDPQAAAACEKIKAQVESLFKDAADGRKLTLLLDPLAPRELLGRVEAEHRYDLAYVPFDYPDDWHPFGLAAYLDPAAAGRDGRNVTGFLSAGTNPDGADRALNGELAGLREHRDFAGDLVPRARRLHEAFNDCVPFVPLWQLDRHALVYTGLKVYVDDGPDPVSAQVLNPTVLFHNVARWRLE